jgi:uncharacterized protein with HEPN domain
MSEKDKLNILSILDAITKIIQYCKDHTNAESLYGNQRDFDAVMMNFMIIGEMVARLSDEFVDQHDQIEWHKIRGLRNIVAHNYFGIDAEEVWDIIQTHLPIFKNDLNSILQKF